MIRLKKISIPFSKKPRSNSDEKNGYTRRGAKLYCPVEFLLIHPCGPPASTACVSPGGTESVVFCRLLAVPHDTVTESAWGTNFNPAGAPYGGGTDEDQTDVYPNEVRGLVHVTGTLTLSETARIQGAIIAESAVTCGGAGEIVHNADLYQNPPLGYLEPVVMRISPGTWCQVVD